MDMWTGSIVVIVIFDANLYYEHYFRPVGYSSVQNKTLMYLKILSSRRVVILLFENLGIQDEFLFSV